MKKNPKKMSLVSNMVIFHFHDCRRKSSFFCFLGCVFKATMKRCCRFFGCYGMFCPRGLSVANIVWKRCFCGWWEWKVELHVRSCLDLDHLDPSRDSWLHNFILFFLEPIKRSKVKAGNETNSVEISVPLQFDIHGNLRVPPNTKPPKT